MKVSCRVKSVDVKTATSKAAAAHRKALTAATEAARMDTLPFVPFVTGDLARTADTGSKPSKGLLVYGNNAVPYARAQYYGLPRKTTDMHPQATMQWFEHAKAAHKTDWHDVMAAVYRSQFGGE